MSSDTKTNLTVAVPDETSGTHITIQYGCRFPDGHHEWTTYKTSGGYSASYEAAANPAAGFYDGGQAWRDTLASRAKGVSLDPDAYIRQHALVKRQVVLTVTDNEEL